MKKIILKLFGFLLFLNVTLLANSLDSQQTNTSSSITASSVHNVEVSSSKMTEVSLDSFGNLGMIIMVILSSLLGMFFVKDEFNSVVLE